MNSTLIEPRCAEHGFTLIELMIAVAIVSILAAVAYPSYVDYIRRGQLPEGMTYLSDYRVKLEQYYQDHRGYGTAGGTVCADEAPAPTWNTFAPSGTKFFTFSCALGADNQSYTLTATGSGGRAVGHTYTLSQSNVKGTSLFKGATTAKTCWLVRGDEC
jgi:type IV pilus assembly protein PilE